jgi:hypothetical protein
MNDTNSAFKALAIAISAFAAIALFWAVILVFVLVGEGSALVVKAGAASDTASGLKITDVTGGITALCALFVAAFSLWTARRHNSLSVRPHLSIVRVIENKEKTKKGLYIRNHGLGPALVDELIIEIDSKKVVIRKYQDLKQLFDLYAFDRGDLGVYWMDLLPKDGCERFVWLENEAEEKKEEFKRLMFDVRLIVKYRSFYEERRSVSYEMKEEAEPDARANARAAPSRGSS